MRAVMGDPGGATFRSAGWRRQFLDVLDARYFLPSCFILYVALRAAVLVLLPVTPSSDAAWYVGRAVEIASGAGYAEHGTLTAFWPVGWPGLLGGLFWLFGPAVAVGQVANLIFAALAFWLVVIIGSEFFGDRRVGRLAALLLTIYPNQVWYVPVLWTEIFYGFLLLLGIWLLSRKQLGWTAAAGAVFGIATLTKAQTPLLPPLLLAAEWLIARPRPNFVGTMGRVLVVCLATSCVVAPWTVRNHAVFGHMIPVSTNGGITLLTGNNSSATGDYTPGDPIAADLLGRVGDQVEADRIARSRAITWIAAHPRDFLQLMPRKFWRLWGPDGEGEWAYQAGYSGYQAHAVLFRAVRLLNQAFYCLLIALALLSLLLIPRRIVQAFPSCAFGWVAVLYFTAISLVFSGQSRFHFALMPWIALYASWTILQCALSRQAHRVQVLARS